MDIITRIGLIIENNYILDADEIMAPFRKIPDEIRPLFCNMLETAFMAGFLTRRDMRQKRLHNRQIEKIHSRKQKQPEWIGQALIVAQAYVSSNKRYSQAKLATHIKAALGDRVPDYRRIVIVVSGWQKKGLITRPL